MKLTSVTLFLGLPVVGLAAGVVVLAALPAGAAPSTNGHGHPNHPGPHQTTTSSTLTSSPAPTTSSATPTATPTACTTGPATSPTTPICPTPTSTP